MNTRDTKVLEKILKEIEHIEGFVKDMTFESFMQDEKTKRSVAMTLVNIGELMRLLSDDFKKQEPGIPYRAIMNMRNIAAHKYEEFRFDYVWTTLQEDVPRLKATIESYT